MSDFREDSLENLLLPPVSGSRPAGGVNYSGEIPSVGGENITMDGGFRFYPVKKVSKEYFDSMPRGHLNDLDVLINKDGANTGKSTIFRNSPYYNASVNEHVFILRGKPDRLDQEYLHYLLQLPSVKNTVSTKITGSAQPGLNSTFIKNFRVLIAPLPEQKKIASILTSVDEAIENTQKQIDKLQNLKKATMNELLTKGIGHTEFKDSELGRIPQSWEIKRLDEVSKISRGKFSHRPRNDQAFYHGSYPYLQTGDVPTHVTDVTEYTQTLNERGLSVSKLFPKGTLVLTIAATIGEVGILTFDSCFPDSLVGISCCPEEASPYFLLYALRNSKQQLIAEAPESAQKNLNLDILNPFLIRMPPILEQKKIEHILLSVDDNLKELSTKLSRTQALKKSLMQDLLTGKVRVQAN